MTPNFFFAVRNSIRISVILQFLRKIVGADFTKFLVKVGVTPPLTPKSSWRGFEGFLPLIEPYRTISKWRQSASPLSRISGKGFPFRPPSGETPNRSWRGNQSSVKLDSKFLHEIFFVVSWSAAEIFEVKRNSNFPVQNMKIQYACPRPLLV